jgi:hypothetical protein
MNTAFLNKGPFAQRTPFVPGRFSGRFGGATHAPDSPGVLLALAPPPSIQPFTAFGAYCHFYPTWENTPFSHYCRYSTKIPVP